MTETVAYVGAALLVLATLPQFAKLVRTRSAEDFGWPFVILNVAGIALLSARSIEIGEPAFIATNVLTLAFWAGVAITKARQKATRGGFRGRDKKGRTHPAASGTGG